MGVNNANEALAEAIINGTAQGKVGNGMADIIKPQLQGVRAELAQASTLPPEKLWIPNADGVSADVPNQVKLAEQTEEIVQLLKTRVGMENNKKLCPELNWEMAERALRANKKALLTFHKAEKDGHEPTIYFSDETGFDVGTASGETPQSTRDCVFDKKGEQQLKCNRPDEEYHGNAETQAGTMGWRLMEVEQGKYIAKNTPTYRERGWSWYGTPINIRKDGFALLGSRNGDGDDDDVVIIQHEADDHHDSRGWRGSLRVNFVD